jgi:CspA family cold shock protein
MVSPSLQGDELFNKEDYMNIRVGGKVKWFNEKKGFGFIEHGGKDYFVHFNAIQTYGFKTLQQGASVVFKPGKGAKGLLAEEVQIII